MNTPIPTKSSPRHLNGFTLIELLTVIAIIAVLFGIITATVGRVRSTAKTTKSISNLRSIGMAMTLWAEDRKGVYPSALPNDSQNWWMHETNGIRPFLTQLRGSLANAESVLVSPALESPSFTGFIRTPISYGINGIIGRRDNRRYNLLYNPSMTILVADGQSAHEVGSFGATLGYRLNPRNSASQEGAMDGKAAILYLDGHVAMIDAATATTISADVAHRAWGAP